MRAIGRGGGYHQCQGLENFSVIRKICNPGAKSGSFVLTTDPTVFFCIYLLYVILGLLGTFRQNQGRVFFVLLNKQKLKYRKGNRTPFFFFFFFPFSFLRDLDRPIPIWGWMILISWSDRSHPIPSQIGIGSDKF